MFQHFFDQKSLTFCSVQVYPNQLRTLKFLELWDHHSVLIQLIIRVSYICKRRLQNTYLFFRFIYLLELAIKIPYHIHFWPKKASKNDFDDPECED